MAKYSQPDKNEKEKRKEQLGKKMQDAMQYIIKNRKTKANRTLSQRDIADVMDISVSAVNDILAKGIVRGGIPEWVKLANAFSISLDFMFGRTATPDKSDTEATLYEIFTFFKITVMHGYHFFYFLNRILELIENNASSDEVVEFISNYHEWKIVEGELLSPTEYAAQKVHEEYERAKHNNNKVKTEKYFEAYKKCLIEKYTRHRFYDDMVDIDANFETIRSREMQLQDYMKIDSLDEIGEDRIEELEKAVDSYVEDWRSDVIQGWTYIPPEYQSATAEDFRNIVSMLKVQKDSMAKDN